MMELIVSYIVAVCLIVLIMLVIGIAMCVACMRKRHARDHLREEMRARKAHFANSIGMNLFEM